MLPLTIPIFPLPNVVLFPNVFLPLHVFEPRYRQMVGDALADDRIIGMVLLQPGHEAEYEGRPPVYPVGCAGVITHAERHVNGHYDIVLRGIEKFRIAREDHDRAYRVAHVEPLPDPVSEDQREIVRRHRARLEVLLAPSAEGAGLESHIPPDMPDEDLINGLAQYLDLDTIEKQALLEREGLLARCQGLVELLEMRVMMSRHTWHAPYQH